MRLKFFRLFASAYWLFVVLLALLLVLQYRLWFGDDGFKQTAALKEQIRLQQQENTKLLDKNRRLEAEVIELKKGTETIEEKARHDLGMVKEGETLYIVPDDK